MREDTFQKILEELGQQEEAVILIRKLLRETQDSCICEHLKKIRPKSKRFNTNSFHLSETIILISLLCCPVMTQEHIHCLLNITGQNKCRNVRRALNRCKDNELLKHKHISLGRPLGTTSIWYLTSKGYKAAMKCYLTRSPIPPKPPAPNLEEAEHYALIADIFCALVTASTHETTLKNIHGIHWYPPHKLVRRYEPQWTSDNKNRYRHLCPDAILENKAGGLRIYLEVDRDTKSLNQETAKLESYVKYFLDTREAMGYVAHNNSETTPDLLIVYSVPSKKRGEAILESYKSLGLEQEYQLPPLHYYEYPDTADAIRGWLKRYSSKRDEI